MHGASELECLPQILQLLHAWKFASWIALGVGIQSGLLLLQLRITLPFLCHDHSVFGLEICSMHLGMSANPVYLVTCSFLKTVGKDGISRPPNDLGRYSRDGSAHLGSPLHIFRYFLASGSKVRSIHVRGRSAMVSSQLRRGIRASL